jgi:hypothetical protein
LGQQTLVGYPPHSQLPTLKPALIQLAHTQQHAALQLRIRKSYVKDYTALEDVKILLRSFYGKA